MLPHALCGQGAVAGLQGRHQGAVLLQRLLNAAGFEQRMVAVELHHLAQLLLGDVALPVDIGDVRGRANVTLPETGCGLGLVIAGCNKKRICLRTLYGGCRSI